MRVVDTIAVLALALSLTTVAAPVKPGEQVVFHPSLGWRAPEGWTVEIRGCVYEPESRRLLLPVLRRGLGIDEKELTPSEQTLFAERMRLFLVDHQGNRVVPVKLGGQPGQAGPTGEDGYFTTRLTLPLEAAPGQGQSSASLLIKQARPSSGASPASSEIFLLAETGLSLISDIDDTIKLSQVRDRHELLLNTFCRPFRPAPGMAEFYQGLRTTNQVAFHYVSASPWQLCLPLADFLRSNGFPAGSFHLRHVGIRDGKLAAPAQSSEQHKLETIEPLLDRYPHRRFLLVGDSGERDPEVYAALARRHAAQVIRIYIRDVTGESSSAPRYQALFSGLPPGLWQVFERPSQIRTGL